MKKYILCLTALISLAVISCRKVETDGEIQVVVVNGGGGTTTGQTISLKGRIDSNITLRKQNSYILTEKVYMVGNHTMTIEPGTVIKGAVGGADVAALIITRGSKLMAAGTPTDPIIFTSASPNPQSGDWGGIVICGKANINTTFTGTGGGAGIYEVEGGINNSSNDGLAGGGASPDDNDNSGTLQYLRIEWAGYAIQPDKEINSLTLAAVGRGTIIDHIQVSYAKDDAYEWFGGTVNAKYLIAYKTQDDDFDTDNGYSGKVQFGLIIRDSLIADISTSEAFESDNNATGTTVTPKTSAIFSNVTAIGPKATLNNTGNSLFRAGAQIRRNSGISIFNSILLGWPQGILIDASLGNSTALNIEDSTLRIRNVTLAGNATAFKFTGTGGVTINSDATLMTWVTNSFYNNDILTNTSDAKLIQPYNYSAPDPTPFAGTSGNQKILTGGGFTDAKFTGDTFFDKTVTFRGAIAPAGEQGSWWKGWTKYNY